MKKLLFALLAFLFCTVAFADTKKADKLFENWEYYKAAKLYEQEVATNPSADVYYKLGECYMRMGDYARAVTSFDHVNILGPYKVAYFYFRYGQALKSNGAYEEAKDAFTKYIALKPTDKRAPYYLESCRLAVEDRETDLPVIVKNVALLNTPASEMCPALYQDGIVFTSSNGRDKNTVVDNWSGAYYLSLYFSKFGNTATDFAPAQALPQKEIDQKYHDGPASFSRDFDTIYFSRVDRQLRGDAKRKLGVEKIKIYSATWANGRWKNLQPFAFNNDSFSVAHPFLSADMNRLYFVSDMKGGFGETDIYMCKRTRIGWGKPVNMGPKINTFGKEKYPYEDAAGNFYFASDGYQGFGGLDICVATKTNGVLNKALPLKSPINSPGDDFGIITLDDGRKGYFSSNRAEGVGGDDIYFYDMIEAGIPTSGYTMGNKRNIKPPEHEAPDTVEIAIEEPKVEPPPPVKPAKPVEVVPAYTDLIIHFDVDKADIRPSDFSKIDKVVEWLKKHPGTQLLVNGHTDTRASEHYNELLSKRRAASAVIYIVSKGIPRTRVRAEGFGYSQLINFCGKGIQCPESQQEENRRVEFKIK